MWFLFLFLALRLIAMIYKDAAAHRSSIDYTIAGSVSHPGMIAVCVILCGHRFIWPSYGGLMIVSDFQTPPLGVSAEVRGHSAWRSRLRGDRSQPSGLGEGERERGPRSAESLSERSRALKSIS